MVDLRFDNCIAAKRCELLVLPFGLSDCAPSLAAEVALEAAREVRWIGRKMEYFCLGAILLAVETQEIAMAGIDMLSEKGEQAVE